MPFFFNIYSLRFKLLVAEMDVSRTKIHLDTSIRATSNSEWREYFRYAGSSAWHLASLCCQFGRRCRVLIPACNLFFHFIPLSHADMWVRICTVHSCGTVHIRRCRQDHTCDVFPSSRTVLEHFTSCTTVVLHAN